MNSPTNNSQFNAYETKLFKKISDLSQSGLSRNSFFNYLKLLRPLAGVKNLTNLTFLKNVNENIEYINKRELNTQKKIYSIILTILSRTNTNNRNKTLIQKYNNQFEPIKQKINNITTDNKSEKQKEKWTEMEQLKQLTFTLQDQLKKNNDYDTAFKMILLALFTLITPRRGYDYINMIIVNDKKDIDKTNINYLVLNDNEFIFYDYKTAKTYGQQKLSFKNNSNFKRILNEYLKYRNNIKTEINYFLISPLHNKQLNRNNGITMPLSRLTKKYLNKNISVNMIRNIYLTEKFTDTKQELKDITEEMGTSCKTAQNIYIKTD